MAIPPIELEQTVHSNFRNISHSTHLFKTIQELIGNEVAAGERRPKPGTEPSVAKCSVQYMRQTSNFCRR